MQRLCRILATVLVLASVPGYAADVKISIRLKGWWPLAVFETRYAPWVSPHHLGAPPPPARDACTFVAGVRHCPLPKPPGG